MNNMNADLWEPTSREVCMVALSRIDADFTDIFFQRTEEFQRVLTPIFSPKPNLTFVAKTNTCWMDTIADDSDLDSARLLAMASSFAHDISKQLVRLGQSYVFSVHIKRPVVIGDNGQYYKSRRYLMVTRSTRAMTTQESQQKRRASFRRGPGDV